MADQNNDKETALSRIINATQNLAAHATVYVAALGSIALIQSQLTPEQLASLALPAGTVGINLLSGLIDRVAMRLSKNKPMSDEAILEEIKDILEESTIADALTREQFRSDLARLAGGTNLRVLKKTVEDGNREIIQRLMAGFEQGNLVVLAELVALREEIKAFTTHFPTAQPSETASPEFIAYLQWLHNTSKESNLLKIMDNQRGDPTAESVHITIDQVYTPLDVQHRTAMEAADRHKQMVLLGDPGSGKSTFVSFLTVALTGHQLDPKYSWLDELKKQDWTHGAIFPVFVTLRVFAEEVSADTQEGTTALVWKHLRRELGKRDCAKIVDTLKDLAAQGKLLVLFDGLDEVPNEKRVIVRDSVADFIKTIHDDNRIIVTCRVLSYTQNAWKIKGLVEETIAPFSEHKIKHFITAWYNALLVTGALDRATADERTRDLMSAIEDPRLKDIAQNPMLLTVMAKIHGRDAKLPPETALLYDRCVEILMQDWKKDELSKLLKGLELEAGELYSMLWQIAFTTHQEQGQVQGAADISESAILGTVRQYFVGEVESVATAKAAQFLDYIANRAGLLISKGYNHEKMRVFTFPHRTFQEYLAGCHIVANITADQMKSQLADLAQRGVSWHIALTLAVGQLVFKNKQTNSAINLIRYMITGKAETDDQWRVIALAGELLLLIGLRKTEKDPDGKELLPRVRERLAALLASGHLPVIERAAAGRTLAVLGDPRSGIGVTVGAQSIVPLHATRSDQKAGLPDILWCPIPAGDFLYGDAKTLTPMPYDYHVSKYPITNAQYQPFVDAGGYHQREWWTEAGWTWREAKNRTAPDENRYPFMLPNHPRVGVSSYECIAYTHWLTAQLAPDVWNSIKDHFEEIDSTEIKGMIRLSSEQEWEKAVRGTDGRIYPWGDSWSDGNCNTEESGIGSTSAVGMFPQGTSPFGVEDMSGNVWEWCLTKYNIYNTHRVIRGGSWLNGQDDARAVYRSRLDPGIRLYFIGFRVCHPVG